MCLYVDPLLFICWDSLWFLLLRVQFVYQFCKTVSQHLFECANYPPILFIFSIWHSSGDFVTSFCLQNFLVYLSLKCGPSVIIDCFMKGSQFQLLISSGPKLCLLFPIYPHILQVSV